MWALLLNLLPKIRGIHVFGFLGVLLGLVFLFQWHTRERELRACRQDVAVATALGEAFVGQANSLAKRLEQITRERDVLKKKVYREIRDDPRSADVLDEFDRRTYRMLRGDALADAGGSQ